MANSLLTPTAVTREALRILHEKLKFIGTVERQYDDSFARTGAKIGDSLKIRLPNRYTVRTGKTLNAQDTEEESVTLTVATQAGVDMNFSSVDLTMDLDDFSTRIIRPAMAVLASHMENDAFSMTDDVYNAVGTAGTVPNDTLIFANAQAKLNQYLAPPDDRCIQMNSITMATMVDHLQGLFHESSQISQQYREGMVGRHVGMDWYTNERVNVHNNGVASGGDGTGAVDEPAGTNLVEGTTTLHMDALGTDVTKGTVFTIAGVKAVHPETGVAYSHDQQFVVTADVTIASNEADIAFSPAIRSTGAKKTVDHLPSDDDVVTFLGSDSTNYAQDLAYHKEAFAFSTADLQLPNGVDFAAREVYDGISMRIVRAYDINNDNFPCRLDVLYGYKTLRAQLACRITN